MTSVLETCADRECSGGITNLCLAPDPVLESVEYVPKHSIVQTGDLKGDGLCRLGPELTAKRYHHGQRDEQLTSRAHGDSDQRDGSRRLRGGPGATGGRPRSLTIPGSCIVLAAAVEDFTK